MPSPSAKAAHFEALTSSSSRLLPESASVVAVLGQIDCREGLHTAVERARYETLEEAVEVSVSLYVDRLRALGAAKRPATDGGWRLPRAA